MRSSLAVAVETVTMGHGEHSDSLLYYFKTLMRVVLLYSLLILNAYVFVFNRRDVSILLLRDVAASMSEDA